MGERTNAALRIAAKALLIVLGAIFWFYVVVWVSYGFAYSVLWLISNPPFTWLPWPKL